MRIMTDTGAAAGCVIPPPAMTLDARGAFKARLFTAILPEPSVNVVWSQETSKLSYEATADILKNVRSS